MTKERQDLGREGEMLALQKLQSLGYECIARNYRCALGEIDLIARDKETLVFVEIKTRKSKGMEYAKSAVTERKKRQLSKAALVYLKSNNCCEARSRFDVVAVCLSGGRPEIEVIRNAFDLVY